MQQGRLEHLNMTVSDVTKTARMLCRLFDWQIRWQGESIDAGWSAHVGADNNYIALYAPPGDTRKASNSYTSHRGPNHVGVVVENLEEMQARVEDAGFTVRTVEPYAPGRRFYFYDDDNIEWEVLSYAEKPG